MKTLIKIKLVCLSALILAVGCKNENPGTEMRNVALQTAKDYEAQGVAFFAYNAATLAAPKDGVMVQVFAGDKDLPAVTDFALENNNLIYGIRALDGKYHYAAMKYFAKDDMKSVIEYAHANGTEYLVNLETGGLCEVRGGLLEDKFVVNQTKTSGNVKIECMPQMYYLVTIDLSKKPDMKQVGKDYGKCIAQLPLMYGARVCGYLLGSMSVENIPFEKACDRVGFLRDRMPADDRDFIDGMAEGFTGSGLDMPAAVMFYMANLLPDALRPTACSAFGVMPDMSATGKTMAYRTLDWPDASLDFWPFNVWPLNTIITKDRTGIVSPLQSVTKIIYPDRTVYSFGMLGIVCGVTSIDQTNRNMVSILDSSTGDSYDAGGKNSYVFDLAKTIRTQTTIDAMANDMKTPAYTFNHLLLMADKNKVGFLENNINLKGAPGGKGVRAMRYWDSASNSVLPKLSPNYLIGSVNCFQLQGQVDNSKVNPALCNAARWTQMQNKVTEILQRQGSSGKLTADNLWEIQTAHSGTLDPAKFDNLYNYNTLQMIQYIPEDNTVRVYMKPFNGKPAVTPTYFSLTLTR